MKGCKSPSPNFVKKRILKSFSFGNATWVETGTYLGETTLALGKHAKRVVSLEPALPLFKFSKKRLASHKNIEILNGSSEELFLGILSKLSGPTCFWLDGHASGDVTFQGKTETPVVFELDSIKKFRNNWKDLTVCVDDVRCFSQKISKNVGDYPTINFLVDWAEDCGLGWKIEHDIFIASTKIE